MPFILLGIILLSVLMGVVHVISRDKTLTNKLRKNIRIGKSKVGSKTKVMFVTAHPDDEVMFFSPTILNHVASNKFDVFILCLSKGDYYHKGHVREGELYKSCACLGIKHRNIFLVDNSELQDDPKKVWDKKLIADIVRSYVEKHDVDVIFTFDSHGVSGHSNHGDVHLGVQYLVYQDDCPLDLQAFQLVSVSIWRKYLSVLDTFYSYMSSSLIFTSPWLQVWKSQQAMYAHWSQFVWYRLLYIMFSRYVIINTYEPIEIPLEMD